MAKILCAGPYVGELGWEFFSWQPLVRRAFAEGGFDKCVVYTGPGRNLLYRFAETRQVEVPKHDAQCLAWLHTDKHVDDLNKGIQAMVNAATEEFGTVEVFTIGSLGGQICRAFYERGTPDLLEGNCDFEELTKQFPELSLLNPSYKTVVACVRDRTMSPYRNWGDGTSPHADYGSWFDFLKLVAEDQNVIVLGRIQKKDEWEIPEGVVDLTDRTTIDDCINIFTNVCDLAVGGSTGTLHLASRCCVAHLVWGGEKSVNRYAETNWFGADHHVYQWGYDPEPDVAAAAVSNYTRTGEFL